MFLMQRFASFTEKSRMAGMALRIIILPRRLNDVLLLAPFHRKAVMMRCLIMMVRRHEIAMLFAPQRHFLRNRFDPHALILIMGLRQSLLRLGMAGMAERDARLMGSVIAVLADLKMTRRFAIMT